MTCLGFHYTIFDTGWEDAEHFTLTFVSQEVQRVFVPRYGMNEDPVTGSTHCMIAPYWSRSLNKPDITAIQASSRTGILYCECVGDKVIISGNAVLFSINDIVAF